MARYIDADEFRREMYHEAFETDSDLQKWDSGCWIRYKMFENAIENFPAVDAVPVKHGHWIYCKGSNGKDYRKCSVCLHTQEITGVLNYCSICGARMDEPTQSNDSNALDALGEKVTE